MKAKILDEKMLKERVLALLEENGEWHVDGELTYFKRELPLSSHKDTLAYTKWGDPASMGGAMTLIKGGFADLKLENVMYATRIRSTMSNKVAANIKDPKIYFIFKTSAPEVGEFFILMSDSARVGDVWIELR